jgi:hypothetical protein
MMEVVIRNCRTNLTLATAAGTAYRLSALCRLSALGPLVSRERTERGELQRTPHKLALREYALPTSCSNYTGREVDRKLL